MTYVRGSENSDVYLEDDGYACYCCKGCELEEDAFFLYRSDVISHLMYHQYLSHEVPGWVINKIEDEMEELGDSISDYTDLIIN